MKIALKPLDQQVMVVFGASSGIGRLTALRAAERGAQVVAAGRDEPALATLVQEAPVGRVTTAVADAADAEEVREVAMTTVARLGRIDTWAHVAGVSLYGRFLELSPEEFRRVVEVDLMGPVHGAMAAVPFLGEQGGAFVCVTSEASGVSVPLQTAYSAAKHGAHGFLEALRMELQHDEVPVSVTEVKPAGIDTPFFDHARSLMGVKPSPPPPLYDPQLVVDAILKAAQEPSRDIVVGGAGRMKLLFERLSPRALDPVFAKVGMRLQRTDRPKASGDDILFEAPSGSDHVRADDLPMRTHEHSV